MSDDPFRDVAARAERLRLEAEKHALECTDDPCAKCDRHRCVIGCGAKVERENMRCRGCVSRQRRDGWTRRALAQIPRGFSEASLDADWLLRVVGQAAIDTARASLAEARVVAVGPPGSGKTSIVAAMVIAAEFPAPGPLWVSAHQLAKARALHPLGDGEAPLITLALEVGLLVVDELGGEDARYASAVAEVLFERHAQDQPTWVTTGVGPKEISNRYGGGIARRVFEDATVFRLVGRSR